MQFLSVSALLCLQHAVLCVVLYYDAAQNCCGLSYGNQSCAGENPQILMPKALTLNMRIPGAFGKSMVDKDAQAFHSS